MKEQLWSYWEDYKYSGLIELNRNKRGYISPHNVGYGLFRNAVKHILNTVPKDLRVNALETFINKDIDKVYKWYRESKEKEWGKRYTKQNKIDKNRSYYLYGWSDIDPRERDTFNYK